MARLETVVCFRRKTWAPREGHRDGGGMLEKDRAQVVFLESLCNMGGSGSGFGNELCSRLCKVEKRVYWEAVGIAIGSKGVLVACRRALPCWLREVCPSIGTFRFRF